MRKVLALLGGAVIGYAIALGMLALVVWTPFGEFAHRVSPMSYGEPWLIRDTPQGGQQINVMLGLGTLLMGGIFSAGFYSAFKD